MANTHEDRVRDVLAETTTLNLTGAGADYFWSMTGTPKFVSVEVRRVGCSPIYRTAPSIEAAFEALHNFIMA